MRMMLSFIPQVHGQLSKKTGTQIKAGEIMTEQKEKLLNPLRDKM